METVNTLAQAMYFFLENSSGTVFCESNGNTKECNSFIEAEVFFSSPFSLSITELRQSLLARSVMSLLIEQPKAVGVAFVGDICRVVAIRCTDDGSFLSHSVIPVPDSSVPSSIKPILGLFAGTVPVVISSNGNGHSLYEIMSNESSYIFLGGKSSNPSKYLSLKHELADDLRGKAPHLEPLLSCMNERNASSMMQRAELSALLAAYSAIASDLPETIEHTDDKTYVAYGFACSGFHASLVKVTSAKDGSDFEYESTEMGMENVSDIVNRIPVITRNIPVAVDMGGYGWQVEQGLASHKGIYSFPICLNAINSPKTTLEESLLEQLAISNSPITKCLNFKKGSRSGSDNADYKAILAAYSLIANPPRLKAEKDEYIEIKGDGYYIKFKASDLNCGKGIDYNVETGQLIISKLPDDVVAQLKELFGDIDPLESAKRSDDEVMKKDLTV